MCKPVIYPPPFTTQRLLLKAVSEKDIPSYERYFIDYEVIRHLSSIVPWPYPEDGVRDFLQNIILPKQGLDRWVWGIFLLQNPEELIGVVDLWRPGKPENRGFWLGRPFWGRGIMTEAVKPIIDFAFRTLGFEQLVFANAKGNIKSRRIKEKTGAKFSRIEPASFVDPQYKEHEIWELSKTDWEKHNEQGEGVWG